MIREAFCDQWQEQRLELPCDENLNIQKSKNSGAEVKWQA